MTTLTWLGAEGYEEGETPPDSCTWGGIVFPVGVAVEVDNPALIAKAKGSRFFAIDAQDDVRINKPFNPTQWREPATEADPADVLDFPPDYPPEAEPERKPGRPRSKVKDHGV